MLPYTSAAAGQNSSPRLRVKCLPWWSLSPGVSSFDHLGPAPAPDARTKTKTIADQRVQIRLRMLPSVAGLELNILKSNVPNIMLRQSGRAREGLPLLGSDGLEDMVDGSEALFVRQEGSVRSISPLR